MAVNAFKDKQVSRIVLTRPAVEAGEKLGFCPETCRTRSIYLRPLYDALHEIMGAESYHKYLEKRHDQVAPLAYMRGVRWMTPSSSWMKPRTRTPEQMKMFLTRIGFGSRRWSPETSPR